MAPSEATDSMTARSPSSKRRVRLSPETASQRVRSASCTGAASRASPGGSAVRETAGARSRLPAEATTAAWVSAVPMDRFTSSVASNRPRRRAPSGRAEGCPVPTEPTTRRDSTVTGRYFGSPARSSAAGIAMLTALPITTSRRVRPPTAWSRPDVGRVDVMLALAPTVTRREQTAPASAAPTSAYPTGACAPCKRVNTAAPSPAEAATRPTVKADVTRGWRVMAWTATVTKAKTSTVMVAGIRSTRRTKNASPRSRGPDSPPRESVTGQSRPAAINAPNVAANTMVVTGGGPAETVRASDSAHAVTPATVQRATTIRDDVGRLTGWSREARRPGPFRAGPPAERRAPQRIRAMLASPPDLIDWEGNTAKI